MELEFYNLNYDPGNAANWCKLAENINSNWAIFVHTHETTRYMDTRQNIIHDKVVGIAYRYNMDIPLRGENKIIITDEIKIKWYGALLLNSRILENNNCTENELLNDAMNHPIFTEEIKFFARLDNV